MNLADIFRTPQAENPDNAIYESNIAYAKALHSAESDPLVMGLQAMGGVALQYGLQGLQKNLDNIGKTDSLGASMMGDELPAALSTGLVAAFGKESTQGVINVEGGEVIEKNGKSLNVKGPKHEQGGVNVLLDGINNIFSNRIVLHGRTIAERKKLREQRIKSLEKKLNKNPKDTTLKDTYEREKELAKIADKKDLEYQKQVRDTVMNKVFESAKGVVSGTNGSAVIPDIPGIPKAGLGATFGDLLGLFGQFYGAKAGMLNTLQNRATDTVNKNMFKDYGKGALQELDDTENTLKTEKDLAIKNNDTNMRAALDRVNNASSSVSVAQARQLNALSRKNKADNTANLQLLSQLANLGKTKANTYLNIDSKVMAGAERADIANRRDKDNFYTQLGKDKQSLAEGLQHIGKNLNTMQKRSTTSDLIQSMNKFYKFDPISGKFTQKDNIDVSSTPKDLQAYTTATNILLGRGMTIDEIRQLPIDQVITLAMQNVKKS